MAEGKDERITLRPQRQLFRQGLLAVFAFMTPVFIVLYVISVPHGAWRAVLVTHIITTVVVVGAWALYRRVAIRVDSSTITEVGFFGRTVRVEADDIGSLFVVEMFEASGTTTLPQLFVRDKQGKQLVRMRGQFWSRADIELVLTTLEVTKIAREDSLSSRELRDEYPGLLYWFERRPVLAALAYTAGTAVVGGLVYALFQISGMD